MALALYAALAAAYFYWLDSVFERPGSYVGAGVVALLALMGLGGLTNARTAWKTASLLAAAKQNRPLRDGNLVAVPGVIHASGKPLIAPFSGAECVLCEYDLASADRVSKSENQENTGSDFAGFLMTPCVIRSRHGDVRLLGFPLLEGFEEDHIFSYAAALRARDFLNATPFEDRAGLKIASMFSVFGEVWSDDDGLVQKNLRLSKVDPKTLISPESKPDLERLSQWEAEHPDEVEDDEAEDEHDDATDDDELSDAEAETGLSVAIPKMTEKRVPPGADVCAIGLYQEKRRGLLPPRGSRHVNRLIRGSADAIQQQSRAAVRRNLIGGVVFLMLLHAAVWGVMQLYLRSEEGQRRQEQSSAASNHVLHFGI
jgi:hypothetical protein